MMTIMKNINAMSLPVEYPIVNSNSEHGYLLSGLQTNHKANEWIMNNYVHQVLYFNLTGCDMNFYPMSNHALCPCIDYQRLSKELIQNQLGGVREFFIQCIKKEYYIYVHLNGFYMSNSDCFKLCHIMHPTIIFGFDLNTNEFLVGDFYKNRKFSFERENIDNVCRAFDNSDKAYRITFTNDRYNGAYDVILYRNRKEFEYTFNVKVFKNSLYDYLNSKNITQGYGQGDYSFYNMKYKNYETSCGISIYNVLSDYFMNENETDMNFKLFTVSIDRIKLMVKRLEFLYKKGLLKNYNEIQLKYTQIYNELYKTLMLYIKYHISQNEQLKIKICKSLKYIEELEYIAYNALIDAL